MAVGEDRSSATTCRSDRSDVDRPACTHLQDKYSCWSGYHRVLQFSSDWYLYNKKTTEDGAGKCMTRRWKERARVCGGAVNAEERVGWIGTHADLEARMSRLEESEQRCARTIERVDPDG